MPWCCCPSGCSVVWPASLSNSTRDSTPSTNQNDPRSFPDPPMPVGFVVVLYVERKTIQILWRCDGRRNGECDYYWDGGRKRKL